LVAFFILVFQVVDAFSLSGREELWSYAVYLVEKK